MIKLKKVTEMKKEIAIMVLLASLLVVAGCVYSANNNPPGTTGGVISTPGTASGTPAKTVSISLVSVPTSILEGSSASVTWRVDTNAVGTVPHTAVHYDTSSHPGVLGLSDGPAASGYPGMTTQFSSVTSAIPGTFTDAITAPSGASMIFLRAHVIVDGQNYWTDEVSIPVEKAGSGTGAPGDNGSTASPPPAGGSTTKEYTITARQFAYEPSMIKVNKGDTVILHITSADVTHGFGINEYGISESLSPGKEVTVQFVADKAGTFTYYCTVPCGGGHTSMKGTLVVSA
jgi:cytochrome c oxidase subunit II